MTYKNTSENLNHIERVASASTRPRANGRIDLIPRDARQPEEYYTTIREQYFALSERFQRNQARLTELNATLRNNLSRRDFERANAEYTNLKSQQTKMQGELGTLRPTVHAAGQNAFGTVFKAVAKQRLDNATFMAIVREVETLTGRNEFEIKMRSEGSRNSDGSKRKERRTNARQHAEVVKARQARNA
jgi:hypothetical protein